MKKLLIVGNMQNFMATGKNILNRAEFEIFTATSAEEALDIHKTERADLIITELDLPGMSGDRLCSMLREDEDLRTRLNYYRVYLCRVGYRKGLQMQGKLIYNETHTTS